MKLTIKLFAVARQRIGKSAIEVELPEAVTIANVRTAVVEQFPQLAEILRHARIAVDSEYAADATLVGIRSELAIIPPVSGG